MIYRTWPGKHLMLFLTIMVAALSCQKPDTEETPPSEIPPAIAVFEPLFTYHAGTNCGSTFYSDLKIREGNNIGHVTVANDGLYLYLTYNLDKNWYLVNVHSYAGTKALMPKTENGSPDHDRFPGMEDLDPCDMRQTFTFRIALSLLAPESGDNGEERYFIAMRASIRHIPTMDGCKTGEDVETWAAPILINPGKKEEWATAFYYKMQDCPPPPPPAPAWCAYGQGYWFASGKHPWGTIGKVTFGDNPDPINNLVVTEKEGVDLWSNPRKRSILEKAFFQASALQLSMVVMNQDKPIPDEIKEAYTLIYDALKGFKDVKDLKGNLAAEEEVKIQNAAGAIGKWICAHNCNLVEDPTACTQ